jgi:ribosome recycling factor
MAYNFSQFKEETKKITEWLAKEYSSLHTGRATPAVLDGIMIEAYGAMSPIKNVASVNIEDPRTLRIAPWDKNQIKDIEKALQIADIGLSIVADSDGIRAIFPMLTTENREKLVKILKDKMEDARISVRKAREEVQNDIRDQEKEGILTEDEKFRGQDELQKLVDSTNGELEALFEKKKVEVMTV